MSLRQTCFLWCCVFLSFESNVLADSWRFSFSEGKPGGASTVRVSPHDEYSHERGYGFEPGAEVDWNDNRSACVSEKPFRFSMRLAEGNYHVTINLRGPDKAGESCQTIRAENRRLMIERAYCRCGESTAVSFVANVRSPKLSNEQSVRLKTREQETFQWDERLTLEFNGLCPTVEQIVVVPADDVPTVFLAGDSTVNDQFKEPWCGWGQILPRFFKPTIAVANHAESGRSLRSFRYELRWEKILSLMKPDDVVLIQFGHNDMKEKGEGIGPYQSYADSLRRYVAEARAHDARPILVTPMHRRWFSDGKVQNTHGDYPDAMRQVARELEVPLVDLHQMSAVMYNALGPEGSKSAFVHYPANTFPNQSERLKDNSHHNTYGAYSLALCVVKSIREQQLDLADHLTEDIPALDLSNPVLPHVQDLPHSPFPITFSKPEGS